MWFRSVEVSGYEIASGNYSFLNGGNASDLYNFNGTNSSTEGQQPALFIIILLGILGIIFAWRGGNTGAQVAILCGVGCMIGLFIFYVNISQQLSQSQFMGVQVDYKIGYWGSWIGAIIMTVAGYFGYQGSKQT